VKRRQLGLALGGAAPRGEKGTSFNVSLGVGKKKTVVEVC